MSQIYSPLISSVTDADGSAKMEGDRQGCGCPAGEEAKLCSTGDGRGVLGILAAVSRLMRKHSLCQDHLVPVQMLLLAEKISGQNFKELREDAGCWSQGKVEGSVNSRSPLWAVAASQECLGGCLEPSQYHCLGVAKSIKCLLSSPSSVQQ